MCAGPLCSEADRIWLIRFCCPSDISLRPLSSKLSASQCGATCDAWCNIVCEMWRAAGGAQCASHLKTSARAGALCGLECVVELVWRLVWGSWRIAVTLWCIASSPRCTLHVTHRTRCSRWSTMRDVWAYGLLHKV